MRLPFLHEHAEFQDLLSIVSEAVRVSAALVEKDYWVTHTLWALESQGFRVFFKGGTSLSKGFQLIERFSEDLDVKLQADDLPEVQNWTSEGRQATAAREAYFAALEQRLRISGARVVEVEEFRDPFWRNAVFAIHYPSQTEFQLPDGVRPFVQLEVGSARVTPGEERPMTSWIHEHIYGLPPEVRPEVLENRPSAIHCVRPEVTLLEKVEAIARRYGRVPMDPPSFIRHYEDAARILDGWSALPELELRELLGAMQESRDIRSWPSSKDPAFRPEADTTAWAALEEAWTANQPLFWGARIPLAECAARIRALLRTLEEAPSDREAR